jgi:hypothetical protein
VSPKLVWKKAVYIASHVQTIIRGMLAGLEDHSKHDIRSIFIILNITYTNPGLQRIYWKTNTPLDPSTRSWEYFTQPANADLWTPLRNFTYSVKHATVI